MGNLGLFKKAFTAEEFAESTDIEVLKGLLIADWLKLAKYCDVDTDKYPSESELRVNVMRALIDKGIIGEEANKLLQTNLIDTNDHLAVERMEMKEKDRREKDEIETKRQNSEFMKWVERKGLKGEINNVKQRFDVLKNVRMVPPFNEEEVNGYFIHFEKLALRLSWPEEYWTLLLQLVLMGKAQEAYSCFSIEESKDYQKVKECILKAYGVTPERYRQDFRNLRRLESQTYGEFIAQKTRLFDQWCDAKGVTGNYDSLKELIIIEDFKNSVSMRMKLFLDEKDVQTVNEATLLSDDYHLTHKYVGNLQNQKGRCISKNSEAINNNQVNEQVLNKTVSNNESVNPELASMSARIGSINGRSGQLIEEGRGRGARVTGSGRKAERNRRYRRRQDFRGFGRGRGRGQYLNNSLDLERDISQSEKMATTLPNPFTVNQK